MCLCYLCIQFSIHGYTCSLYLYGQVGHFSYSSQADTLSLMTLVEQTSACDLGFTSPSCVMNDIVQCSAVLLEAPGFHLTSFMGISIMGPQHIPY